MRGQELPEQSYAELVRRALDEDLGSGDVTTLATVPEGARGVGRFVAKSRLVLAGLPVALAVFRAVGDGLHVGREHPDGSVLEPGDLIATVEGPARLLLTGERVALNFLQRLSGIATLTQAFVLAAGDRLTILDTRKTTPTMRLLERYAVRVGGGTNHRFGLFDAFLIKDNHIRVAGGIANAVTWARASRRDLPVEIEAQSLTQVDEALEAGVDILLLDNLTLDEVREAVRRVNRRAKVEVSGGVTLAQIPALAGTGADFVSVGALTHSAPAADVSFEIELAGA